MSLKIALPGVALLVVLAPTLLAQEASQEWSYYGGDPGGQRYSPLKQIDRANVGRLEIAWRYDTGERGENARDRNKLTFELTPIVFEGLLYVATAYGKVVALDPASGSEEWVFDAGVNRARSYSEVATRGVAAWRDGEARSPDACSSRIFLATIDARLVAIDARTGHRCADFGESGEVDLTAVVRMKGIGIYQVTSPPAVFDDRVIVGSSIGDNWSAATESGVVRAFDARSGHELWSFHPLSASSAAGRRIGAGNAWAPLSTDPGRGFIFVSTSSPSPDFFGGLRPGDNQRANSVVALDGATGEVLWSFQTVHHDLFDYDLGAQPTLATIRKDGADRDVVVQATKMGFLFVLDRDTGKPVFPVEERPVPKSNVPGEKSWPTQPFPVLPAPLGPTEPITEALVWGIDEEDRAACLELMQGARSEGIFTPPSLEGTILFPGNGGGTRWGGVAFDPARNLLLVNSAWTGTLVQLIPRADFVRRQREGRDSRFEFGAQFGAPFGMRRTGLFSPKGLPCTPPPWGTLTAIDLDSGMKVWEVPLGGLRHQHPLAEALAALGPTGGSNAGGPIATAGGLVFIAATSDKRIRAFDVETGGELWAGELPYAGIATPMTYEAGDRQYVVIAAGGHGKAGLLVGDAVVAFALPSD
ncbi:MAG: pyrroloquinoline quinone-dependent dehydrogenase [Longimicrobiales bacterium]